MATKKQLKNNDQLRRAVSEDFVKVIEYVMDRIEALNEAKIDALIYGSFDPLTYNRTYQFGGAWGTFNKKGLAPDGHKNGNPSAHGEHIRGKFAYDPQRLEAVPPSEENEWMGIHHGIYANKDVRQYLAEIIYEGAAGLIYGSGTWTKKRDVWTALLEEIGTDNFRKWFEQGMKSVGMKFIRNSMIGVSYK